MIDFTVLTPRELDILKAQPSAGTHAAIAHGLGISVQTVKNHVSMLLRKVDCATLAQAALLYDRQYRTCSCACGCNLEMGGDCAFCAVGSHP